MVDRTSTFPVFSLSTDVRVNVNWDLHESTLCPWWFDLTYFNGKQKVGGGWVNKRKKIREVSGK